MHNVTLFDTKAQYIFLPLFIVTKAGKRIELDALLDTGAPRTEFSDHVLQAAGFMECPQDSVKLQPGLQTQKYGKVKLPQIEICSHLMHELPVYVSHFEKSWGIDALIGLDFFRRFRVTIDYGAGHITTEPLPPSSD